MIQRYLLPPSSGRSPSETSANLYQTTRRYNPEDSHLRTTNKRRTVSRVAEIVILNRSSETNNHDQVFSWYLLLFPKKILAQPNTVIPRYTRNRFAIFRLYEMHRLICFSIYEPIFAYTSSFLSQTDRCSRREINFCFASFRLTSSFGGTN
jgi:hypothetical protein